MSMISKCCKEIHKDNLEDINSMEETSSAKLQMIIFLETFKEKNDKAICKNLIDVIDVIRTQGHYSEIEFVRKYSVKFLGELITVKKLY